MGNVAVTCCANPQKEEEKRQASAAAAERQRQASAAAAERQRKEQRGSSGLTVGEEEQFAKDVEKVGNALGSAMAQFAEERKKAKKA